jgi:aminopeptidase N
VSVHQWRDIWLNEGFATFMEQRYSETHGGQVAQRWLERSWTESSPAFWQLPIGDPGEQHLFDPEVYRRGAMTLQALRHRVGEADFWTILRSWVHDRAGGTGDTEEFEALADQVSGQDLSAFFQAWLFDTGRPAHTADNGF